MSFSLRRLPDAELEVMQAVWDCSGPATRTDIEKRLATARPLAPTTVLTLLSPTGRAKLSFYREKRTDQLLYAFNYQRSVSGRYGQTLLEAALRRRYTDFCCCPLPQRLKQRGDPGTGAAAGKRRAMNYFQIILGLILWAATSFAFSKRQEWENQIFTKGIKSGANTALTEPLMLPFVMLFILLMLPCLAPAFSPMFFFAKGLQLFLQISVYYGMLLLLSPLLRKAFSARACADFWILPTLLYFSIYLTGHETEPLLALPLPRQLLAPLGLCWLVGFLVTFFGQLLSHFQYRHFLLQKAKKPEKSGLAAAWYKECRRHGRKKEIPILISPDVH